MSPPSGAGAPPRRILVVDDDEHTRSLLRDVCESAGHRVSLASDGEEALTSISRQLPDLVLLDLMMPKQDGFGVLTELRKDAVTERMPVILLTANADLQGKIRGMELGATDYVTKPFKVLELQTRIASALTIGDYRQRVTLSDDVLSSFHATDPLTGAGTFAQLKVSLDTELVRARQYGLVASVLLLGIDDFAHLRYRVGHQEAENLLADVAHVLRSRMRGADRLFRLDQDEFVLLLPQTSLEGARVAAERIAASMQVLRPRGLEGVGGIQLRIAGAAFLTDADQTSEALLREAYRRFKELEASGELLFR